MSCSGQSAFPNRLDYKVNGSDATFGSGQSAFPNRLDFECTGVVDQYGSGQSAFPNRLDSLDRLTSG